MRYRDDRLQSAELRRPPGKIRRRISVLPTLCTLGNLLSGFAAIWYASGQHPERPGQISAYAIAGYLVFAAMLFDLLDGSVARLTKATSDFGAELDSLADVVSFGIVPAFLTLQVISNLLAQRAPSSPNLLGPVTDSLMGRSVWIIAAIYVSCTALRLARFNAHNRHALEAHMVFRGLPSPGAAGVVASSVIFFQALQPNAPHVLPFHIPAAAARDVNAAFPYAMPLIMLAVAILMVSRIAYGHLINQYLRGRRPFSYVVRAAILAILIFWQPQITALVAIYIYAFFAPIRALWRKILRRPASPPVVPAPPGAA